MKTAKDIMTANPKTLWITDHFDEAVKLFLEKRITSIPILDADNKVLGVFTEQGLIKAFVMNHSADLGRKDLGAFKTFFHEAKLMPPNTPIGEVMQGLVTSKTFRVLIHDNNKNIIGVVSPRDIMRALKND